MTFSLKQLGEEQAKWALHNFGVRPPHQPLRGIGEEFGELATAYENDGLEHAEVADAVADFAIFSADYCNLKGWDLQEVWDMAVMLSERMDTDDLDVAHAALKALGRLNHHDLKAEQKIRLHENHDVGGKGALTELFAIAMCVAKMGDFDYLATIEATWKKVSKRDFVLYPGNGLPPSAP